MLTPEIFTTVIDNYLPEPQASLLAGIIFGVDFRASKDFFESLKKSGLLHIVVLSGMNITLLVSMISITFARFGRKASGLLSIILIFIFIIFVGPQAPIVRAAIMGIIAIVAILYGYRAISIYILFISAIFIALFWPQWIHTLSFQLSFGATLGIILFAKSEACKSKTKFDIFIHERKQEFRTSLAAQVFTAPLIFFHFKQISLISPIANVLVAPVIAPLMIFGFACAILGKIHFLLGLIPSVLCLGLLTYIIWIVQITSAVPFSFFDFGS